MEDLKSLRSRLMGIQQKSSQNRLSERNVVEILQKLVEKFDLKIIYCLSGKDYLTPGRLVQEIIREVMQEGRISLLDLPSLLNVSIENIENRVTAALGDKLVLVNGQLMSKFYLTNLCEEINLALQESGQLQLADLTVKYSLPMAFLKQELENKIGSTIQGQFSGNNTLVTDTYIARHLGKLRGTLRAIKKPFDIKSFDTTLSISQTKHLIETAQIQGKLDGTIFTPTIYQNTIWSEVKDYYFVNKFIEFDYIKKRASILGLNDIHSICDQLGAGEYLRNSYCSPDLITETKERIIQLMSNKDYSDFFDLDLPSCIDEEDIDQLITAPIKSHSHYIYTDRAISQALTILTPLINSFIEETKDSKSKKKETLSLQSIQNELKKKKFLNAPLEFLEGFCEAVYSQASQTIIEKKEARGKPSVIVQENLPQDFNYLYLCNKSLQSISQVHQNVKPVQVHIMKTLASNFFSDMIKVQLNHHGFPVTEVKLNDRPKLIQKLPEYLREIFIKIGEKVTNKDLDGFIQDIVANKKDIPVISLKLVDKKTERSVIRSLRSEVVSKLQGFFNSKDWISTGVYAARLKMLDQGYVLEVPCEKWSVKVMLEIYSSVVGNDVLSSFLQILMENTQNEELAGLSEQVYSFVSS